jgi:hypothetical protein
MYRRIEMISHYDVDLPDRKIWHHKAGICYIFVKPGVAESWEDMPIPRKRIPKNGRYYFTEKGWDTYGRKIIKACLRSGQEYRVLKIKENAGEPLYKDDIQVVVRPLKKRS